MSVSSWWERWPLLLQCAQGARDMTMASLITCTTKNNNTDDNQEQRLYVFIPNDGSVHAFVTHSSDDLTRQLCYSTWLDMLVLHELVSAVLQQQQHSHLTACDSQSSFTTSAHIVLTDIVVNFDEYSTSTILWLTRQMTHFLFITVSPFTKMVCRKNRLP